ncbi:MULTISPECIES: SDR family NAD(P)-dependent oxidoreductase [unclassified Blastococcus]
MTAPTTSATTSATTSGRFAGRTALVTGAGSGIGAATAAGLLRQGAAHVYLADVDTRAIRESGAGPASTVVDLDVADARAVDAAVDRIAEARGGLDVVVHAAGVDDGPVKQQLAEAMTQERPPWITAGLTDQSWRRVMAVNLDGTFHVLRAALRVMAPHRRGTVVVIGSSSVFDTPTGIAHYAASKAGVHALTQAVAKEAIPFGIRVNGLAPGPTDTGMAARTPAALRASMSGATARPYATPDEIADIALFLASEESRNVVGEVLLANGGRFTV